MGGRLLDFSVVLNFITRKVMCVGWGTGKYLKVCAGPWGGRHKSNISVLPVRFSQSSNTLHIYFLAVKFINRLKSTSIFVTVYSFCKSLTLYELGEIQPFEVFSSLLLQTLTFSFHYRDRLYPQMMFIPCQKGYTMG